MQAEQIALADGRRLSYVDTGPRHGFPIVYCHGAIGSSLERSVALEAIAWDLGVRHISISRPGFGASDPAPGRNVLGFAGDVRQLTDRLELDRFGVVGVSAGGAYALALAHALPDRVERVALCSGLSPAGPLHRTPGMPLRTAIALRTLARAPGACAAIGDALLPLVRSHPAMVSRMIAMHAAASERAALREPSERRAATASFLEAAAGGVRGMVEDYLTCARHWGFSPAGIDAEVHLWHGLTDRLIRIDDALALAASLPRCRIFVDPDEGHHFFRRRLTEILATLVDGAARRDGAAAAAKSAA